MIQEGLSGLGDALIEGVTETAGNVKDVFADIGTSGAENFTEAFEKSMRPQKIANVTEEGLQMGIDNTFDRLKEKVSGIFAGGVAASTTGGTTATTTGGGDADPTFGDVFGGVDSGIVDPETIEFIDDVDFDALHQGIDETVSKMQTMKTISETMGQGIQDAFGAMGQSIVQSLGVADGAWGISFVIHYKRNAIHCGFTCAINGVCGPRCGTIRSRRRSICRVCTSGLLPGQPPQFQVHSKRFQSLPTVVLYQRQPLECLVNIPGRVKILKLLHRLTV